MTSRNMFVGISGFSYAGWKGKFYPEDMKNEDFLTYYAQHLNSVEINSSFYAPPNAAMVKSWSARTTEGFRFAFKAPKQITHILKLGKGSSETAEKLSKTLDLLGPRRGPVLFQLPPHAKQDLKLLENSSLTQLVLKVAFSSLGTSRGSKTQPTSCSKNTVGGSVLLKQKT